MKKIYSRYDRPVFSGFTCTGESRTQQHFKDDCDINNILARFLKTGTWYSDPSKASGRLPQFGTFDPDFDFRQAQETIVDANRRFMQLPASVRERFGNDPAALLQFVSDPANKEECYKFGFLEKPIVNENLINPAEKPQESEVVKEG